MRPVRSTRGTETRSVRVLTYGVSCRVPLVGVVGIVAVVIVIVLAVVMVLVLVAVLVFSHSSI